MDSWTEDPILILKPVLVKHIALEVQILSKMAEQHLISWSIYIT